MTTLNDRIRFAKSQAEFWSGEYFRLLDMQDESIKQIVTAVFEEKKKT